MEWKTEGATEDPLAITTIAAAGGVGAAEPSPHHQQQLIDAAAKVEAVDDFKPYISASISLADPHGELVPPDTTSEAHYNQHFDVAPHHRRFLYDTTAGECSSSASSAANYHPAVASYYSPHSSNINPATTAGSRSQFTSFSELLKRKAIFETPDKKMMCPVCGKGFRSITHLKDHYNVHTQERPYPCPYCPYKARQSSRQKEHVRMKHREQFKIMGYGNGPVPH